MEHPAVVNVLSMRGSTGVWGCAIRRQAGAGMIEVMVAIVIVAFALLGMAGLQASSLRYQKTAHVRGLAAQYTSDIADRIRANMAGAAAGSYVTGTAGKLADGKGADPGNCGGAATLTAAQAATCDIYNWRASLDSGMKGWGEISGNVASGFTVMVYMHEPNKNDTKADVTADSGCRAAALAATDYDVRCFSTVVMP